MGISKYLTGYAIIKIEGESIEAFTNLAMERNIPLWDLMPLKNGFWQGKAPLRSLPALRHISRHSNVYFTVLKKLGLPQWGRRLLSHRVATSMVVLTFCFLIVYTQSVLGVKIIVDGSLSAQEQQGIIQTAADYGIKKGLWQRQLPWDQAAHGIMAAYPKLAWVGFSRDGVILSVKVIVKDEKDGDNAIFGDVVAKKDGVIRKLLVLQGQGRVEINTPVKKGDSIIGGEVSYIDPEGNTTADSTMVHAKGIVTGSVWYVEEVYVSLNSVEPMPTGKSCDKFTVIWQDREYLLWGRNEHGFTDFSSDEKQFQPWHNLKLVINEVREVTPEVAKKTKKEALVEAKTKAYKKAMKAVTGKAKIVGREMEILDTTANSDVVGIRITLETLENLGTFQKFAGNL